MQLSDEIAAMVRPWMRPLFLLVVAVIIVFGFSVLWPLIAKVLGVLSPFIVALVVAYVFHPVVTFVQRKLKLGRLGGIAVVAVGIALFVMGMLGWLIPMLYTQLSAVVRDAGESIPRFIDTFMAQHLDPELAQRIKLQVTEIMTNLDGYLKTAADDVLAALKPMAQGSAVAAKGVASGIFLSIMGIIGFFGSLVFTVIIALYYLADMHKIPGVIQTLLPTGHRGRIWEMAVRADKAVGGFLRGQLTACVGVGVLVSIGLFFVGLKQYAVLIGFFAGLFNFIPYLGPAMGAIPAMLWVLMTSTLTTWGERGIHAAIVVGLFALVQAIDGFIFQPFVVGKQASLHPLAVMLALAVGAQAGLAGMIVAVPLACIVKVIWVELVWRPRARAAAENDPLDGVM